MNGQFGNIASLIPGGLAVEAVNPNLTGSRPRLPLPLPPMVFATYPFHGRFFTADLLFCTTHTMCLQYLLFCFTAALAVGAVFIVIGCLGRQSW